MKQFLLTKKGVALVYLPNTDCRSLMGYYPWLRLMLTKFNRTWRRPLREASTTYLRKRNTQLTRLYDLEVCIRANTTGAEWTPTCQEILDRLVNGSNHEIGSTYVNGGSLIGFSVEKLKYLRTMFGTQISGATIEALCHTLDRRYPTRLGARNVVGIKLMRDFFNIISGDAEWPKLTSYQIEWFNSYGAVLIENLQGTSDISDTVAAVHRWVNTLAAERKLTPEFVSKQLQLGEIL